MTPPKGMHRCPGRCGRSTTKIACPRCWRRLPRALQVEITATASALTREAQEHRRRVVTDARDWWLENPAPPDPDAHIAGECQDCGGLVLWLNTENGKRMPVDEVPDGVRGNVVRSGDLATVLGARHADTARAKGVQLYLPHVVSCPANSRDDSAAAHRKAKR